MLCCTATLYEKEVFGTVPENIQRAIWRCQLCVVQLSTSALFNHLETTELCKGHGVAEVFGIAAVLSWETAMCAQILSAGVMQVLCMVASSCACCCMVNLRSSAQGSLDGTASRDSMQKFPCPSVQGSCSDCMTTHTAHCIGWRPLGQLGIALHVTPLTHCDSLL